MRKISFLLIFILSVFVHHNTQAQCASNNTFLASYTLGGAGSSATYDCPAGYYINVNLINGGNYTFTTCGVSGYDTQISLYNGGSGVGYNDDNCGLQSTVNYTANFTGTLSVLIDQYSCSNSGAAGSVTITVNSLPCAPPADPGFGTNVWNVIVWNAGNASGDAGAWTNNYAGSFSWSYKAGDAFSEFSSQPYMDWRQTHPNAPAEINCP